MDPRDWTGDAYLIRRHRAIAVAAHGGLRLLCVEELPGPIDLSMLSYVIPQVVYGDAEVDENPQRRFDGDHVARLHTLRDRRVYDELFLSRRGPRFRGWCGAEHT